MLKEVPVLAALLLCVVGSSVAIQCYTCIYLEDSCGQDCKGGSPSSRYLSSELSPTNLPPGITDGIPTTCTSSASEKLQKIQAAFAKLATPNSANTTQLETNYPYCVRASMQIDGQDAVLRGYFHYPEWSLSGLRLEVDYQDVEVKAAVCDWDRCNSATGITASLALVFPIVAIAVVKYFA